MGEVPKHSAGERGQGSSREDPRFRAQTSHILAPVMLGHMLAEGTSGPEPTRPWPFLKQEQFSCTGLGSSLKPISRCERGLWDISAALVSAEKPSLTGTSAQGVQVHPSHQAQSSSKQTVNSALPVSAISEKREGERPQRTAESGNVLPKNIKCLGHEDTGQRKDAARQRCPGGGEQQDTLPRPGHSPSKSLAVSYASCPIHPGSGLRPLQPHIAPSRWSTRPRGPRDWLQHNIVAPAASVLHHSLPGARSTGGVPGSLLEADPALPPHAHGQRLLLAPCAKAACPWS